MMHLKTFEQLTIQELYDILKLRQDVFVVEQDCVYADIDGADRDALHLCEFDGKYLRAYLRIFGPGKKSDHPSIGRILVHPEFRATGLGPKLIRRGIQICEKRWPSTGVYIEAQAALLGYYRQFGFIEKGEIYEWDGIDHIQMVKPAPESAE